MTTYIINKQVVVLDYITRVYIERKEHLIRYKYEKNLVAETISGKQLILYTTEYFYDFCEFIFFSPEKIEVLYKNLIEAKKGNKPFDLDDYLLQEIKKISIDELNPDFFEPKCNIEGSFRKLINDFAFHSEDFGFYEETEKKDKQLYFMLQKINEELKKVKPINQLDL